MEIIRFAALKAQPWRNGGGVTRELASRSASGPSQGDPGPDGWDWRVSIADVSRAGDFPAFRGMDRVLTVVEGELLLLNVDGAEHPLEKYRPFRFSGDAAASAALPTGDIRDLDVMTRTGVFKGFVSIVELSKKRAHPVFEGQLAILLQGQAAAAEEAAGGEAAAAGPTTLVRYDAVVGSDTGTPEVLGRGFLAVVSIDPVSIDPVSTDAVSTDASAASPP